MTVLSKIRARFEKERPFEGLRLAACSHVTKETAALCLAMQAGGADTVLVASNPLSTQDDVAAALVKYHHIPVYAIAGESVETYKSHIQHAIEHKPNLIIEDGCDLVSMLHTDYPELLSGVIGSTEETSRAGPRARRRPRSSRPDGCRRREGGSRWGPPRAREGRARGWGGGGAGVSFWG